MKEKEKLDNTQKTMIFVSILGGAVGLVLGGAIGGHIAHTKGFLEGINTANQSMIDTMSSGLVQVVDVETGEVISPERLKNIKFF